MRPDEKLVIAEKMKIDQKEFDVLKENQMVKLLIEVEKLSAEVPPFFPVLSPKIIQTKQLRE